MKQLLQSSLFIFRDTEIDSEILEKYIEGKFFVEPTFCDATATFGGINGNVRFLIVTASPKDLSMLSLNPEFKHSIIGAGELFKVIGIVSNEVQTQITVLHIPGEFKDYFAGKESSDFERAIKEHTDPMFDKACSTDVAAELTKPEWTERVKQPLGMNQNNEFVLA